jgi:peptide/nickel transport system permease protein
MVSSGRNYFLDQWWYATFPGLAILVAAIGFNLVGDGLRDLLDPKLGPR